MNMFRRLILILSMLACLTPVTVQAQSWTILTDEDFSVKANTAAGAALSTNVTGPETFVSPSTGANWIDKAGSAGNGGYTITSGKVVRGGAGFFANAWLLRPAVENQLNTKHSATFAYSSNGLLVVGVRYNDTTDQYYAVYIDMASNFAIARFSGATGTLISTTTAATYTAGHRYIATISAVDNGAGGTTLNATLADETTPGTLIKNISTTDSTANLQGAGRCLLGFYTCPAGNGFTHSTTYTYNAALSLATGPGMSLLSTNSNIVGAGKTKLSLVTAAATGGTGPYTYQWYRSTSNGFTPGAGNAISGATSLTLTDSGLTAGTTYYYKVRATDAVAATADSPQSTLATSPSTAILAGFIGDSITYQLSGGSSPPTAAGTHLSKLSSLRTVVVTNAGLSGSTTGSWAGAYSAAVAAFAAAECDTIHIMLGTNDAKDSVATSAAAHKSNLQTIIAGIVAGCPTVQRIVLSYSPGFPAGVYSSDFSATALTRLASYQAQEDSLVGTGIVKAGDKLAYSWFIANPSELQDGLHPGTTGVETLGTLWSWAIQRAIDGAGGGGRRRFVRYEAHPDSYDLAVLNDLVLADAGRSHQAEQHVYANRPCARQQRPSDRQDRTHADYHRVKGWRGVRGDYSDRHRTGQRSVRNCLHHDPHEYARAA